MRKGWGSVEVGELSGADSGEEKAGLGVFARAASCLCVSVRVRMCSQITRNRAMLLLLPLQHTKAGGLHNLAALPVEQPVPGAKP